jgi:hypothetical protein
LEALSWTVDELVQNQHQSNLMSRRYNQYSDVQMSINQWLQKTYCLLALKSTVGEWIIHYTILTIINLWAFCFTFQQMTLQARRAGRAIRFRSEDFSTLTNSFVSTHLDWSTAIQAMRWVYRYDWSSWMSEKLLFRRTDVNYSKTAAMFQ